MEIANASTIAESTGCFFRYDETMKAYAIYVGMSVAYIVPDNLLKLEESKFKMFLLGFMSQEMEDIARYGGPTFH